ncbi:MAG TPA: type III secretion system cytoplasmic ring protein SctQ [Burkholderiaceae bacterium]|nr:type III secretion system cytoplasmic ring protein SctQ [Burkholderiaceae bacterium]
MPNLPAAAAERASPQRAAAERMPDLGELGDAPTLPRIDAATLHALNRLYGSGAAVRFTAREADWVVHWRGETAAAQVPRYDSYHFKLGPHAGRLVIETLALAELLGEPRCDRLPRELRHVLLADALQDLAGRLEQATRLRFEWAPGPRIAYAGIDPPEGGESADEDAPPAIDAQRAAFFHAAASGRRFGGCIQFEDSAALPALVSALVTAAAAAPSGGRGFEWLRIPLPFRLGTTTLSLREIGGIRSGDILSVLEWSTVGRALRVTADVGGPCGCRLTGLAEGSQIILQPMKDLAMNRDLPAATDNDDAAGLPLDRLDALEVALRFEVGGLSVSLGELRSIRAGHVFDLGQPLNRCPVRILAHGNVLGHGHLVAVGDRLGVRVAEFAPGEL